MNKLKTVNEKALRKNLKFQRHLSLKDDLESQKRLEILQKEELEILQRISCDKERKEKRIKKNKEKKRLESFKKNDDKQKIINNIPNIPNNKKTRIHRKNVIRGINEYKMNLYIEEQIKMRLKLKEFIESIETED